MEVEDAPPESSLLTIVWQIKTREEEYFLPVQHTDTLQILKRKLEAYLGVADLSDHFLLVGGSNVILFDDYRTVGTLSLSDTKIVLRPTQSTICVRVGENIEPLTICVPFETTIQDVKEQVCVNCTFFVPCSVSLCRLRLFVMTSNLTKSSSGMKAENFPIPLWLDSSTVVPWRY
jgi:hypothetical protein